MPRNGSLQDFRIQAQQPGLPTINELASTILRGSLEGQTSRRPRQLVKTSPSGQVVKVDAAPRGRTYADLAPRTSPSGQVLPDSFEGTGSLQSNVKASESSGNYQAVNSVTGALGAYQFMPGTLAQLGFIDEAGKWTGKGGVNSAAEFLASKSAQDLAWSDHVPEMERQLRAKGAWDFIGTDLPTYGKITKDGLLKGAHIGGAGGVNRFLTTGQNATDAHGTSVAHYELNRN